ncbi:response regulator transcription factor [Amycolatopsis sp. A133]|uniref:response regulator transcription factor n=1 Tax=Amycolatopsis sp. A133 TaxID=3064472 RepID=UPI0027ED1DD0|nr:response regulator transcription factor [Amycolatopsis sp. A133]MDQ7807363.1 response regulator transcription factor [Amycolatopsis sp. A133]
MVRKELEPSSGRPGADDGTEPSPGELDAALRLVRDLLDWQIETAREVEAIMLRLLEASWDTARGQSSATAAKLVEVLTSQESKVLQLIFLGRSNRQIAKMLGITEKTAKNYVQAVFRKLRVHSRTEAVLVAVRNQWFEGDSNIVEPRPGETGAKPDR